MFPGFLITIVLTLLIVGVLLWAINATPWIEADVKQMIRVIIIVAVAFYLIFALVGYAPTFPAYPRR